MAASRGEELVGRESELGMLTRFLADVPDGPTGLLLEGEAGIGKTSLWRAGIELARKRSFRVLQSRPSAAELRLSFAGLGDLLRDELDPVFETLPSPQRRALEAALLLADSAEARVDFRSVGLGVLNVLRAYAREGPTVIAVDDLQWLDSASTRVLQFALRRIDAEPVALLAGLRSSEIRPHSVDLREALVRPPQRLALDGLSEGALRELLYRRLGLTLSRPLLTRLHAMTEGNPFFALEIGRALATETEPPSTAAALPVPETLHELVEARLARLPSRTRKTLLAAAALSQPTMPVLAEWAGSEERLARDLERARRAGIIELEEERIHFTHPLLAGGVYAGAPVPARRGVHRELAGVVSEPEERARHLARAAWKPDADVAASLADAAAKARARGAPDAALELLEEGLRLTPDGTHERARLMLGAADCAATVGDLARARTLLERIMAQVDSGPRRAAALMRLAHLNDDWEAAEGLLVEARAEADDDLELLIDINLALSYTAWATVKDLALAHRHASAGRDLAATAGDEGRRQTALARIVGLEVQAGEPVREEFRALVARPAQLGAGPLAHGVWHTWALALNVAYDEVAAAIEILKMLSRAARERGDVHALAPVLQGLSLSLWRSGDWQAARRAAQEAVDAARLSTDESALAYALSSLAWVEATAGRDDAARLAAAEGMAVTARTHLWFPQLRLRHALAVLELALGNVAAAGHQLDGLASTRWAAGYANPGEVRCVPDEVEVLVALGERSRAEEALEPFESRAQRLRHRWGLGTAARCRGVLAGASGDLAAARDAFGRAIAAQRSVPEPYELGRTLLAYGVSLRRAKARRAAREALEEAAVIFERLGAGLWLKRVNAEVARTGTRPTPADELTPTERRVAELVAEGKPNKAVAAELFVSVKAVERNLSSVYRKLGIASRTQLARHLRDPERSQTLGTT